MPRTLTEQEITAAWLRRQAAEFILRAEWLEASVPERRLTGGMTAEEAIEKLKEKINKARRTRP